MESSAPPQNFFGRRALPPALASALIPLAAFAWFWFWRSNTFSGGDSEQWERYIDGGIWIQGRQPLAFAAMQLAFKVANALWDWPARWAINFTSCASGAAAARIVWRLMEGSTHRVFAFAVLMTAGFTTIFYGHIETYAMPACAFLGHLLAIRLAFESRAPRWLVPATYFLAAAFHLVLFFAAPALLWTLVVLHRSRPFSQREAALQLGTITTGALAVAYLVSLASVLGTANALIIRYNWENTPRELLAAPWRVFVIRDWSLRAWFMLVNAGAMGPLALWAAFAMRRDLWTRCALGYLACFLGFTLVWLPHAERADFDLYSFPWIVAAAIFARGAFDLPGRAFWVGLALGANLWTFLARPAVFAQLGSRGSGEVRFEQVSGAVHMALIDERLRLRRINRLPEGGHEIACRVGGSPPIRRIINLRPGDVHLARFDGKTLEIERASAD